MKDLTNVTKMKNLTNKGKTPLMFLGDAYKYYLKQLGVTDKIAGPYTFEENKNRLLAYAKSILAYMEYKGNKTFKFNTTDNGTVIGIYLKQKNVDVLLVEFDLSDVEKISNDSSARLYLFAGYGSVLTAVRNYLMKDENTFMAI